MAQMVAGEAGLGCRGRPRRVSFVLTLWNKPKISPRHSPPVQVFVRPQRPERGASTHVRFGEAEFGNLRPGPIHSRASTTLYSAGLTDGRRVNRMSRRVSGSLTPLKQAISISSRRRMASRPSSLSKSTGRSFPLTASHVTSKAFSKISRSSGSNLCRSDLNKTLPPRPVLRFGF
jgi:hypothetical protein